MAYKYVAYTPQKKVVKGTLGVSSESMAVEVLERAGLMVLSLKKARSWSIKHLLPSLFGARTRDVVLFSRQLAMLLERGTGFLTALKLSRDQTANGELKRILSNVVEDVEAGNTLSAAVAKHPLAFPLSYSRMMKVGEETGNMEVILRKVADNMERDAAARNKVRAAMTYPAFILLIGIVTVVVLITAALPPLTRLFTEFDTPLPWTTRALLAFTDFVSDYKLYILGAAILLVAAAVWYVRRPSGRERWERLIFKLPVIGRLTLVHDMSAFSRIMALLLGAGLPMTEVMTVARRSMSSQVMRRSLAEIPRNLYEGQGLSQAMKANRIFPSVLVQMVATGEETNTLDSSFEAVADHYDSEFDDSLAALTSYLEPVLLLLVGLVVGFIAVSVIMPIYSVYDVID